MLETVLYCFEFLGVFSKEDLARRETVGIKSYSVFRVGVEVRRFFGGFIVV